MKKGLNRNVRILIKASIMSNVAAGLFYPLYAVFIQNIGGSLMDVGFSYALFSILTGIFIIAFDRSEYFVKRVRFMIPLGYFLVALSYFSYILVKNPAQLFCVQILSGLAQGILVPAWQGVFAANMNEKQESRAQATWAGTVSIVYGFAAFIGGFIVTAFSFTSLFAIMGTASLLACILSMKLLSKASINLNNTKSIK
ncbi:Major Facilitator Superfamily protein [uncultured archaeon]|nr:Major Facilitator Superfamily protein [uncultured archaeon]